MTYQQSKIKSTHTSTGFRDGQVSIQMELEGLRSSVSSDHTTLKRELEGLHSALAAHASQLHSAISAKDGALQSLDSQLAEITATLAALHLARSPTPLPETRILQHLRFPSMHSREDQVRDPNEGTFEWILAEIPDKGLQGQDPRHRRNKKAWEEMARERARGRFLTWLTTGNGIFHISGKAGSGKSTLMKALTRHQRTMQELTRWAEGKRLLAARLFFWPGSDEMQNCLEGLHRSILFEALRQCQELIPQVFPDAYAAFSTPTHHEVEDPEAFFRPGQVRKAFSRLISSALPEKYRLCFFIDGLDEYGESSEDGGQDIEHHELAMELKTWAQCPGIKILASSRPGFDHHFSDSMRIRLHEFTRDDIFIFTRDLLRKHQNFKLIEVKHEALCWHVVDRAEGVFLWARAVARLLHLSLSKRESLEAMNSYLRGLPKAMEKLYASLLERLDEPDQHRARVLLLYASHCTHALEPVSLIPVLWVDEWIKPGFPVSSPPTRAANLWEIHSQMGIPEARVRILTQGLLECQAVPEAGRQQLMFSQRVVLYHRSVRDFVEKDAKVQEVSHRFPALTNGDMFYRLRLAELMYAPTGQVRTAYDFMAPGGPVDWHIPGELMESYLRCLRQHHTSLHAEMNSHPRSLFWDVEKTLGYNASTRGSAQLRHRGFLEARDSTPSFDHWAVYMSPDFPIQEYEVSPHISDALGRCGSGRGGMVNQDGLEPPPRPSLLLSAALGGRSASVKTLLALGYPADDKVVVKADVGDGRSRRHFCLPVWATFALECLVAGLGGSMTPVTRSSRTCFPPGRSRRDSALESGTRKRLKVLIHRGLFPRRGRGRRTQDGHVWCSSWPSICLDVLALSSTGKPSHWMFLSLPQSEVGGWSPCSGERVCWTFSRMRVNIFTLGSFEHCVNGLGRGSVISKRANLRRPLHPLLITTRPRPCSSQTA